MTSKSTVRGDFYNLSSQVAGDVSHYTAASTPNSCYLWQLPCVIKADARWPTDLLVKGNEDTACSIYYGQKMTIILHKLN